MQYLKHTSVVIVALLIGLSLLNADLPLTREPTFEVRKNVAIDLGFKDRVTAECFLTINPANSNHLLAGVLSAAPDNDQDYGTIALASFDGGESWKHHKMPMNQAADPWGIILPDGEAILGDIGLGSIFRQSVYYSPDGGRTWRPGTSFGDGHDHDMFVQDASSGTVYLLTTRSSKRSEGARYELFVARSTDGGKTFPVITTHSPFPNLHFNAKTPVILSDGTLAIPIVTLGSFAADQTKPTRPETAESWLVTSKDGGQTFSEPMFITDVAGRRHNGLAVNPSQKWKDHLYYVCPGPRRNGLYFMMSTDRGLTWSRPRRLDRNTDKDAFTDLGAVAVHSTGVVGVIWIDRIDDSTRKCQHTYFAASTDGGKTFHDPLRVSTAPSCPGKENGWVGEAWPQGGDYCGLVPRPDGSFIAMWSDARKGAFQLYTAEIRFK